ncbi:MAG: hypothetical protein J6A62_07325 [Oscillospiraceae bacterium]|nr:hypothetical protein [Oscillospiraceae bacterium]
MKTRSKALLLSLCAVLLVAASVLGTMAYLTDSEAVTNTFTVGQVHLTLDEADVKPDGTKDGDERVQENTYHLIPGRTYIKDPTIYVSDDSEDCYLFVKVENGIAAIETKETGKTIADQMTELNWVKVDGVNDLYVLVNGSENPYAVSKGANVVVFENFTIDGDKVVNVPDGETVPEGKVDLSAYASATVKVTAYAVQAAGFENQTPKQIWESTFGK